MLKKTFFAVCFCLILSASPIWGQKKDPTEVNDLPKMESRPAETSSSKTNDSKSNNSSSKSSDQSSPKSDSSSSSDSSRSSGRDKSSKIDGDSDQRDGQNSSKRSENGDKNRGGGGSGRDDKDRDKNWDKNRDKDRDHHGKRDDDKDDKDDKDRRRKHRDRDRDDIWNEDKNRNNNPVSIPSPKARFDRNDIIYRNFDSYTDSNSNNYLPYFQNQADETYIPLARFYLSQVSIGTYPFIDLSWAFYYEPDENDVFVNFSKFARNRYEKLVVFPIGETADKVAKKYKNMENRPILVEDISNFTSNTIVVFSMSNFPRGEYSVMLLGMAGETVKVRMIRQ
jgi:hypothetical protein